MPDIDIASLSFDYGKVLAPTEEELREGFRLHLLSRARNDIEEANDLEGRAKRQMELADRHRARAKALEEAARGYE